MQSTSASHDPSLAQPSGGPGNVQSSPAQSPTNAVGGAPTDLVGIPMALDSNQIMSLLRNLPMFDKGAMKEDAAQTLSNLSQSAFPQMGQQQQHPYPGLHHQQHHPGMNDPGPSSHPRGPPNLGQLSAVAMQAAAPMASLRDQQQGQQQGGQQVQEMEEGMSDGDENGASQNAGGGQTQPNADGTSPAPTSSGRSRASRNATMGSDEWSRQRKDNHKEVERRRRGNINEGINELGRIVPNGSGEKAKGAILSRAVQYIHHLKENEARNIEKWTLEKLLMDQAMGDLQAQLEEMRRLWEEERMARTQAEGELEVLRGIHGSGGDKDGGAAKRKSEGVETGEQAEGDERLGKRTRTD